MTAEGTAIRLCEREDARAVLELWAQARSGHAATADRLDDLERLIGDSPGALLVAELDGEIVGALIAALVAFDDRAAGAFWESAGYPQDQEIGRRVRNL